MIPFKSNKYDIGDGERFDSLTTLLEYYHRNPMLEIDGTVTFPKQPFNSAKVNAFDIDFRVKQLQDEAPSAGKVGFWEELETLRERESECSLTRNEGQKPENRNKNRYKNILPLDHTRIKLRDTDTNEPGSDYINANLIEGDDAGAGGNQRSYIATQGCLPSTRRDFWQMVWQENSRIIVMTTKEIERGKSKCERYWPEVGEAREFGRVTVRSHSEAANADYTLREFTISRDGADRKIFHYHFQAWPDHGVPSDAGCVLNFLNDVNTRHDSLGNVGPIIVHCSAGVGRTGTFIVIDMLINRIKKYGLNCELDIRKTIKMVRCQRSGMVQTEAQYQFVYSAIRQYIRTMSQHVSTVQEGESRCGEPGADSSLRATSDCGHRAIVQRSPTCAPNRAPSLPQRGSKSPASAFFPRPPDHIPKQIFERVSRYGHLKSVSTRCDIIPPFCAAPPSLPLSSSQLLRKF